MAALPATLGQSPTAPLPVVGQNSAPGQPAPGGAGGASMPTPNRGNEAAAKQQVAIVVQILEQALTKAGSDTEIGQSILAALKPLSKLIMPGDAQGATVSTEMKSLMQRDQSQQPMIAALRGGASGGAPPSQSMAA